MDFGFNVPMRGPLANRDGVEVMARRGEELGFAYLAIPDHIVIPRSIDSRYPYSDSGDFPGRASGDCLEQLTVMAYLAAITTKVRILTSIMVVPHRSPVHTAKILSTVDQLSKGRVTIGCGAGWMAEEFKAIGAPPFSERGRVTDEYLQVFKELWTKDQPAFKGNYTRFSDVSFLPKPVQDPHPPIWIGGESLPALRRVVKLGDAWYPIGSNPHHPLNTKARYVAALDRLRQLAEQSGRDPASITLAYWANWFDETKTVTLTDGQRHLFTGSAEDVAGDIVEFRALGVRHLLFNFQRATLEQSLASMEYFVGEILPLVGDG